MTYIVKGLDAAPFLPLFDLPDEELAARSIVRMTVTAKPNFPCRISLTDRDLGEKVLLLNHVSDDVANPYRASHAIFVGQGIRQAAQYVDEIPPSLKARILSLRGFDREGMMADAVLAGPGQAEDGIETLFADPAIVMIHAHNATRGCFAAKIERN